MANKFVGNEKFCKILGSAFANEAKRMEEARKIPSEIKTGKIKSSNQIDESTAVYALFSYVEEIGGDRNVLNILVGAILNELERQKGVSQGLQNKINDFKNYW